ncbi:MAG: hypothetical protein AB8B55_12795 [Mariniblastus sp.]
MSESFSKRKSTSTLDTEIVEGKIRRELVLSQANNSNLVVAEGDGPVDLEQPFTFSFWSQWKSDLGVLFSQSSEDVELLVKLNDGD